MHRKQECIPVGCVSSAAVAVSRGGLLLGVSALGGSALLGGGVCSCGVGVSALWGVPLLGGVCSGGGIPACTEADTPPVDRQTPVKT